MYNNLYRSCRDSDVENKLKYASKPSEAVMIEHEGHNSLFIIMTSKDIKKSFKEAQRCI